MCQSVTLGSSVEATVHSFSNSFSTNNFICNTLSVRGNVFNLFSVSNIYYDRQTQQCFLLTCYFVNYRMS